MIGQTKPSDVVTNAATIAYTEFLLTTAKTSTSSAPIVAAMTPCMRLYAFLGQAIQAARGALPWMDSTPYQDWIDEYCSTDFEVRRLSRCCLCRD